MNLRESATARGCARAAQCTTEHSTAAALRMVLCRRPALVLALLSQSRFSPAAARQSTAPPHPPPPPPPPLPLIPLESGTPLCTREALTNLPVGARPVFTAFGGSNSQGANALSVDLRNGGTQYGPHVPSFANLLSKALGRGFETHMHADGGSGPSLAGTCTSRFIPPETRVGTVEFLPNIGYIKDDRRGPTLSLLTTSPPWPASIARPPPIFARHHGCRVVQPPSLRTSPPPTGRSSPQ